MLQIFQFRLVAFLLACFLTTPALTVAKANTVLSLQSKKLGLPHEKYRLKNGLEVILQHDDTRPYVAVSVWYHVGAINEIPGKTGFAHLFEHLMFQGTPHVGDDKHFAYLEGAGATVTNGTTDLDRTNYYEVVPANELDLALWLESDRMGFLMDGVTQEKLDNQRSVVKNERLQTTDNQPYGKATEKSWQTLFPPTHPYHGAIIGSLKDLDAASLDDVRHFFSKYYSPANATITIVGDFDKKTIRKKIEKYFGSLKSRPKPLRPRIKVPEIRHQAVLKEQENLGKLTLLEINYLTPAAYKKGDADFNVLAFILAGDKSSRLTQALQFDKQLVQSINVSQKSFENVSVFTIEAMLKPKVNAQEVLDIIDDQMAGVIKNPPTKREIEQAVNNVETRFVFVLQELGGNAGRAELLQAYNHYLGKPDFLQQDLDRYRAVTPQSIAEMAQKYLTINKRVVLVAEPKEMP